MCLAVVVVVLVAAQSVSGGLLSICQATKLNGDNLCAGCDPSTYCPSFAPCSTPSQEQLDRMRDLLTSKGVVPTSVRACIGRVSTFDLPIRGGTYLGCLILDSGR